MHILSPILNNPYHRCGAIVARLGVNLATLIWSILVLTLPNATQNTSYSMITTYVPENVYGLFFGVLSAYMIWRIIRQYKPNPIGIVAYGILLFAWGVVLAFLVFNARPVQITAISAVSVIWLFALYGFVANPKRPPDVPAGN